MLRPALMLLPLALAACMADAETGGGTSPAPTASSPAALLPQGQEWRIVSAGGMQSPADTVATLTRTDKGVAGSSGCNRFFGGATITESKLSFDQLAGTMMACPGPEMEYEGHVMKALESVDGVTGTVGGKLTLTAGGKPVAELKPMQGA